MSWIDYQDREGWAGVVWQHPANDWGDRAGGWADVRPLAFAGHS